MAIESINVSCCGAFEVHVDLCCLPRQSSQSAYEGPVANLREIVAYVPVGTSGRSNVANEAPVRRSR